MTGLRTIWGCDLNYIELGFGKNEKERIINLANKYMLTEMLTTNNEVFITTAKGKFFADGIASDLFKI